MVAHKKVVTFGEIMMRLTAPHFLRFSQTKDFTLTYGGSEANVAASLSYFGIPAEFVTRLPDNGMAHACIDDLRANGLHTDGIVFGGKRIGLYFLESGAAFRNSNVVYDRDGSSFATLKPGMIDWESIFKDAGWFHWSGISAAITQDAADACLEALQVADKMGLTISCDLNYRKKLWQYGRTAPEVMAPLLQYSDVIFGAEAEYCEVMNTRSVVFKAVDENYKMDLAAMEELCKDVLHQVPRCKKVFLEMRNSITSNHNLLGAVVYSNGTLKKSRIYAIESEVDRMGAGDAFAAGMIYGLMTYPDDDQKTLDFALAASALKNTIYGDINTVSSEEVASLAAGNTSGRVNR